MPTTTKLIAAYQREQRQQPFLLPCRKTMRSASAAFFILLSTLAMLALNVKAQSTEHQPNIIFILTDDQRVEEIECMPKLQRLLKAHGTTFTSYVDTVALCCPSRVSILRGQYAHNTGVLTNNWPNGGFQVANKLGIESSTVATWLHDVGYNTALIGKYLNHFPGDRGASYIPPGWDYWESAVSGNPYNEYGYKLNKNGTIIKHGNKPNDYGTDVYARDAVAFLQSAQAQKRPFFLWLALYAPHDPATCAPRDANQFGSARVPRTPAFNESDVSDKPQYIRDLPRMTNAQIADQDEWYRKRLRSLQAVDDCIEGICTQLRTSGQLDDTYIFFASDNGFHLGEHRLQHGKQTAYEIDLHVPLIVRGPGIANDKTAHQLVGNIDLAPTFADIAQAHMPAFVDGRSMLPLLHKQPGAEVNWRHIFLVEHWPMEPPKSPVAYLGHSTNCSRCATCSMHCAHTAACYCEQTGEGNGGLSEETVRKTVQKKQPAGHSKDLVDEHHEDEERFGVGGIPEFHGLRTTNSTYVEYSTGEHEYYKIHEDPEELHNLSRLAGGNLAVEAHRVELLKRSGGPEVRKIEDETLR